MKTLEELEALSKDRGKMKDKSPCCNSGVSMKMGGMKCDKCNIIYRPVTKEDLC